MTQGKAEFVVGADVGAFKRAMREVDASIDRVEKKAEKVSKKAAGWRGGGAAHSRGGSGFGMARGGRGGGGGGGGGGFGALGSFGGMMMGGFAGMAAFTAGSMITGGIKNGVRSELDFRKAMAKIDSPLGRMGADRGDVVGRVGAMERKTGIDDSEIADMLSETLNAGEKDIDNAFAKIALATDIASAGFADAGTVLSAMNKGGAENTMMMKKLAQSMGITIEDHDTLNSVLTRMKDSVGGTAEAQHKAGGAFSRLGVAADNFGQQIGSITNDVLAPFANGLAWIMEKVTGDGESLWDKRILESKEEGAEKRRALQPKVDDAFARYKGGEITNEQFKQERAAVGAEIDKINSLESTKVKMYAKFKDQDSAAAKAEEDKKQSVAALTKPASAAPAPTVSDETFKEPKAIGARDYARGADPVSGAVRVVHTMHVNVQTPRNSTANTRMGA